MSYSFSQSQIGILTTLYGTADSSGNWSPVYQYIYDQITDYQEVWAGNVMRIEETPKANVDASVWQWVAGARGVNSDDGEYFSDFIRDYTTRQYELRYGSTDGLDIDEASNKIAKAFAEDILNLDDDNPNLNHNLPEIDRVGRIDAGEIASGIFEINAVETGGNYSPWAGTILFPFLGQGYNASNPSDVGNTFLSQWVLTTDINDNKKLGGTYDLISIAQTAHDITTFSEAFWNSDELRDTLSNNNIGFGKTAELLKDLREAANTFFQDVYGLPDIERFQIGGDLPLYSGSFVTAIGDAFEYYNHPNYIIGKLTDDTGLQTSAVEDIVHGGLGNDVIIGSEGDDLIDGGEGVDTVSYATLTNQTVGVSVSFETIASLDNFFDHRAVVYDPVTGASSFTDYLYDVEKLILTNANDTVTLNGDVSQPYHIDGGDGQDTATSASASSLKTGGGVVISDMPGASTQSGKTILQNIENISDASGSNSAVFHVETLGHHYDLYSNGSVMSYQHSNSGVTFDFSNETVSNATGTDTFSNPTSPSTQVLRNVVGSNEDDTYDFTGVSSNAIGTVISGTGNDKYEGTARVVYADGNDVSLSGNTTFVLPYGVTLSDLSYAIVNYQPPVFVNSDPRWVTFADVQISIAGYGTITAKDAYYDVDYVYDEFLPHLNQRGATSVSLELTTDTGVDTVYMTAADSVFAPGTPNFSPSWNVTSDPGAVTVTGTMQDDTIDLSGSVHTEAHGYAGDDVLTGSNSANILHGGDGNDRLNGGAGNDQLFGGFGDDIYEFSDGQDTIDESGLGSPALQGGGNDTLLFGAGINLSSISFDILNTWDLKISLSSANFITIKNQFLDDNDAIENLQFNDGSVIDLVNGLPIVGTSGNDTLNGGSGDNTLVGGIGNDTLNGGGGSDIYIISYDPGSTDTIVDFEYTNPNEQINLSAFDSVIFNYAALISNVTQSGNDTHIDLGSGQTLVLQNFQSSNLSPQNFIGNASIDNPVVAQDDSFTIDEDNNLNGNVLADNGNGADSDPDGQALSVLAFSGTTASGGSVVVNADGSFTYTPQPNFNGVDSFTYTVTDGSGSTDNALVTLTVNAVNDAPTLQNDSANLSEDSSVTVNVLDNDSDADQDTLQLTAVTGAQNGNVTFNSDGTVTYTPNANFNGLETLSYTATDGNGESSAATLTLTIAPINDTLEAKNDVFNGTEDNEITGNVLVNNGYGADTDPDGQSLSVNPRSIVTANSGIVVLNSDGSFTYTPQLNFNGVDSFSYTATDGAGASDTAVVTLNVSAVNDAPVVLNESATLFEDTSTTINVLNNDSDVDGDALSVTYVSPPQNGTAIINSDNTITYTPNSNFNGTETLSYTVSDGNGGTRSATINLTVLSVNDGIDAKNDYFSENEDTVITGNVLNDNGRGADSDPDGQSISVIPFSGATAQGGAVVLDSDGSFTYRPALNFDGVDLFSYSVTDGNGGTDTAFVTLNVNSVNDAPLARDVSWNLSEDTPLTFDVLFNDSDVDGDNLQVTNVTGQQNGSIVINANNTITYTPNANFNGTETLTYTISDGNGGFDTATINLTVAPVNDIDAKQDLFTDNEDETITGNVLNDNGFGADSYEGQSISVNPYSGNTNQGGYVILNSDGSFSYTPLDNFNGTDSFSYFATDGNGASDTALVTFDINSVNDAPVAQDGVAFSFEDSAVTYIISSLASDVDQDNLQIIAAGAQNGSAVVNLDNTVTYTPNGNFNGLDILTYTVSDGNGGFDTANVTLTIAPVNDAPDAQDDIFSGAEDGMISGSVLANNGNGADSDIDNDQLSVQQANILTTQGGSVELLSDGSFIYTPQTGFSGSDSFQYAVFDGNGGSDTGAVYLTVHPAGVPIVKNNGLTTNEDAGHTKLTAAMLLIQDNDTPNTAITLESLPENGQLYLNYQPLHRYDTFTNIDILQQNVTYKANSDFNGTDSFDFVVSDGTTVLGTQTFNMSINPVNDAPVTASDYFVMRKASVLTANVLDNNGFGKDIHPDGDVLNVTMETFTSSNGAYVSLSENGDLVYAPINTFVGEDSFSYTVTDSDGESRTETVDVLVENSVNIDLGNSGDDVMEMTSSSYNKSFGYGGDDVFYGSQGHDEMNGGAGNDTFYTARNYFEGDGKDIIDGGEGVDTVIKTLSSSPFGIPSSSVVDLQNGYIETVFERDNSFREVKGESELINIENVRVFDAFNGTHNYIPDPITIIGSDQDNVLESASGNDTLYGLEGQDTLIAGAGNDTLYAGNGTGIEKADNAQTLELYNWRVSDTLLGGAGNDVLYAGDVDFSQVSADEDPDVFYLGGGGGDDVLYGGTSSDMLEGGTGNDRAYGGDGDDTFIYTYGDGVFSITLGNYNDHDTVFLNTQGQSYTLLLQAQEPAIDDNTIRIKFDTNNYIDILDAKKADGSYKIPNITTNTLEENVYDVVGGSIVLIQTNVTSLASNAVFSQANDVILDANIVNALGGNDVIDGTLAANVLLGGDGHDTVFSHGGDDVLSGGSGKDYLDGGDGVDTADYKANAQKVSVDLSQNASYEDGDNDAGVEDTLFNIENVTGSIYDDTLIGDNNNNVLRGDAGTDMIMGGGGDDELHAGDGTGVLWAPPTNDPTSPSGGLTWWGWRVDDTLDGGAGNDTLYAGDVDFDQMQSGHTGNQYYLIGGTGNDTLIGGNSVDKLDAGEGVDIVRSGDDYDWIIYTLGDGILTLEQGQGTVDKIRFYDIEQSDLSLETQAQNASLDSNTLRIVIDNTTDQYIDVIDAFDDNGNSRFPTLEWFDHFLAIDYVPNPDTNNPVPGHEIFGDNFSVIDALYSSPITNIASNSNDVIRDQTNIDALGGNDVIYGSDGNDIFSGGSGNDFIYAEAGDDILSAGLGLDTLNGGQGSDTADYSFATAGVAVDLFEGSAHYSANNGRDTLISIENIIASSYDDILTGDAQDNTLDGGSGIDTVNYSSATSGVVVSLLNANWTYDGTNTIAASTAYDGLGGTDTLLNVENVIGSDHKDYIRGSNSFASTIYAGAGHDQILGQAMNDVIYAGTGNDFVSASGGDDTVYGDAGRDNIFGGNGNDELHAGDGDDWLNGGAGDDLLYGDAGVDIMTGGSGNDTLYGGEGNDIMNSNDGDDTLYGGAGDDTMRGYQGNDTLHGGDGNDLMFGGQTITDSYDSDDVLYGDAGDDILYGLGGSDELYGGSGNDNLYGYAGNDILQGGEGRDTLRGGDGNDTLYAEGERDILYGESGADTFLFEGSSAFDDLTFIRDFSESEGDVIDISNVLTGFTQGTSDINDFVILSEAAGDTFVWVDSNGAVAGGDTGTIARITGTGLDLDTLFTNGNIVV